MLCCPVLRGIITRLPPDVSTADKQDWCTIVPGKGLELVVKDLRADIPAFKDLEAEDFPPQHFTWGLLMPIPEDLDPDSPHDACKLQFSAIDGGTILTFAMSHCVSDGTGIDEWMRILIEEMRLAQEPLGSSHPFGITPSEIPLILRISADGLARGSKQTRRHMGRRPSPRMTHSPPLCGGQQYSSACSPLLQSVSSSTTTNLFMPSDARRHLPSPYVGNVIYQLVAALDIGTLLLPSGLQRAASEVRRAITYVTPALVATYMSFIMDPTASRFIDYQYMNGTASTTGLAITTCLGSGNAMYGGDWGKAFGSVARFRLIGEPSNLVMPKLPDGSAEVMIAAKPEEVEFVKGIEGFGKYLAL